jgi:hypothetical protein
MPAQREQSTRARAEDVLPKRFHRIRHYGLLASTGCKANIARARELIATSLGRRTAAG